MRDNKWSTLPSFKTQPGWHKLTADIGEEGKVTAILYKVSAAVDVRSDKNLLSHYANKPLKHEHLRIK